MIKLNKKHSASGICAILLQVFSVLTICAADGYRLWLRYDLIENESIRIGYQQAIQQVFLDGQGEILKSSEEELLKGLSAMLGHPVAAGTYDPNQPGIIAGVIGESRLKNLVLPCLTQNCCSGPRR